MEGIISQQDIRQKRRVCFPDKKRLNAKVIISPDCMLRKRPELSGLFLKHE